jgi:hypothetical protein
MFSDMVMVGDMKMTRSALITLTAGLILSLSVAIFVPHGVFIGLFMFLGFIIAAYNLNCVVVGKCTTWALVLTAVYIVYVLMSLIMLFTNKKKYGKMLMASK